ncbi:MAG TPA: esterase-like activity of phytase family protein [Rhizomicrobium sp.]|nr:esterase-like activity of phytase family protein [Rhizomicrobium sp.]
MRRAGLFAASGAFALLAALGACATEKPAAPNVPDAIAVSYKVLPLSSTNPKEDRVGALIYRGGIEISSPEPRFGGWSGLMVSTDGTHLLSQSDEAHWLRANLIYDAKGNLAGIEHAQLADMQNLGGAAMVKKEGDAEGLAALSPQGPDGPVIVSFEGNDRVWRYDVSHSLDVKPETVPMPDGIHTLKSNLGLEGLTMFRGHSILAVAEDTRDVNGDMKAWLVPYPSRDADVQYGQLGVKAHAPYEISDAAMGPDGNLYLLERHYFGPIGGVVCAVREIDRTSIKAGARLEGKEIAEFSMRENIDNMEGLSLRRTPDGKTLLYMISDDNYNHAIQRTVLLMFELQ